MDKDISQITTYQSGVMQSTAHRILTRIKTEYLSQYGLTSTQWFVIGYAYDAGSTGIRLNDLMKVLDTTMPFITTIVNLLESKDILQKVSDTSDSRVKIARLNPTYRSTVEEIESGLREELRVKLYREDSISREELATYISVLYKIAQSNK
ncbi:MAG: Transcriptional regulator, MarR family [Candidatus Saccharibacteria bacterium]|nr:Transcriptional regulator, MarR family [Candidatus Saccharibacteria bacterium]